MNRYMNCAGNSVELTEGIILSGKEDRIGIALRRILCVMSTEGAKQIDFNL